MGRWATRRASGMILFVDSTDYNHRVTPFVNSPLRDFFDLYFRLSEES